MIDIYVLSRLSTLKVMCDWEPPSALKERYDFSSIIIIWQYSNQMAFLQAPTYFLLWYNTLVPYYSYPVPSDSDVLF